MKWRSAPPYGPYGSGRTLRLLYTYVCMCVADSQLSSDVDSVSDTGVTALTVPTVVRLTSPDNVSMASGDSQHQLPYHMMLDDNTSVDRASYSDTEGLLRGDWHVCTSGSQLFLDRGPLPSLSPSHASHVF